VLDRDAAAAGTRVVLVDLHVFDRRIGARVDLDAAAVGVEKAVFLMSSDSIGDFLPIRP
jgi:hypothetical protein